MIDQKQSIEIYLAPIEGIDAASELLFDFILYATDNVHIVAENSDFIRFEDRYLE